VLEIEDLVCAYGPVRAVDGVSLTVDEGAIVAVLGANGAGKTSLLRAVSGLLRPRSGEVRLNGQRITGVSPEVIVQRGMAHVPEGGGAITELSVDENLRLGGLWRRGRAERAAALGEVYQRFSVLEPLRGRLAGSLSGGERQVLCIGRALMAAPRVLLLDEPSLGLAPRLVAEIMELVAGLRAATGLTVVLVEQNARSALSIANRGVVLNLGKVVAADDAGRLAADDQLRHAYLGF
jgi:branched-chain amino acid transport system ATP-binding protein